MMYYRMALWDNQSSTWRWKSSPCTSLDGVLGWLRLYHCVPREHLRVFLSTSPEQLEGMLKWENQGLLSTAVTVDQLWDKYRVNWYEVRRLEIELGTASDHDQAYMWSLSSASEHALAWTRLLSRRERGA
jgi:hypothetical protein